MSPVDGIDLDGFAFFVPDGVKITLIVAGRPFYLGVERAAQVTLRLLGHGMRSLSTKVDASRCAQLRLRLEVFLIRKRRPLNLG